ncbi:uncharacterized protein FIESC28_05784 [Fusarium coffeatum]|uniref:Aromatic amino acid beta-eliminating lyase/threonine aldolase domain-containing protein n=1 Tax=Fusarium coffeatum TaxID=231269 RepID=A0A366RQ87_9HYPO|nr:uncharacterized protein FIESC28_05784 [Fusarium coffeatum]RBR18962.1 hypothetical protein FIESC28_05784 [Fusarium coffeatum]
MDGFRRRKMEEREDWIKSVDYNLFKLEGNQISIDLLTDNGTGSMSCRQWAAWAKETGTGAGPSSFAKAEEKVRQMFGLEHVLFVHQGRTGGNILLSEFVKENNTIPANSHTDNNRAYIEFQQATAEDCPLGDAFCITNHHPFKGNIDIQKLEFVLRVQYDNVPFILVSITCEKTGGQPISIQNLREVKDLARQYGVPVVFDSARFAENAWFIQQREPTYASSTIRDIVREMHQYADAVILNRQSNGLVGAGCIVATRDRDWFEAASRKVILFEGHTSYGEMPRRYMEALIVGLDEMTCDDYLRSRVCQVERFGEKLATAGVPIQQPIGGHAVAIDAANFLPNVPRDQFVAHTLAVQLYVDAGIRGTDIGTLMNDRDPNTGHNRYAQAEFMCLAIPRRIYSDEQLNAVFEALIHIHGRQSSYTHGFQIMKESGPRRYITVSLARVSEGEQDLVKVT